MGMTVGELIAGLESMPKDAEVRISYDYGDYAHTEVADEIHQLDFVKVERNDRLNTFEISRAAAYGGEFEVHDAVVLR